MEATKHTREFNTYPIKFLAIDGEVWVNVADMANSTGTIPQDWSHTKETRDLANYLEKVYLKPVYMTIPYNPLNNGWDGFWISHHMAISYAHWISTEIEDWIKSTLKDIT